LGGGEHHGDAQRSYALPDPGNDLPTYQARASTHPARARSIRVGVQPPLIDGKQLTAVLRIKPLRRLRCCALSIGGVEEREHRAGSQNFHPRPSAPGFSRVEKPGWQQCPSLFSLSPTKLRIASAPCISQGPAERPSERETPRHRVSHQAPAAATLLRGRRCCCGRTTRTLNLNFYPRPLRPGVFPSCEKLLDSIVALPDRCFRCDGPSCGLHHTLHQPRPIRAGVRLLSLKRETPRRCVSH
jgi:hypothetical protein